MMGQAKIVSGGPTGLYNVTLIKHPGKSVARLAQIDARLLVLGNDHGSPVVHGLIVTASAAVATATDNLIAAQTNLDATAVRFAAGTATRVEVTEATKSVLDARGVLTMKQRDLSTLRAERVTLSNEKTRLQQATAEEARTGVWCTDLTENLAAGVTVGTMEMDGADSEIILAPGGSVAKSVGMLQHAGVSSPSAVFLNKARLPGWQKWKPNYRVGTIVTIDYALNTCSVGIGDTFSSEQGLLINQTGEVYKATKSAVGGWDNFAAANPDFPLVTNTQDTPVTLTETLKADLASVQADIQNRFKYQTDTEQYGKLENWTLMQEGGQGDCEDFSLTKAQKLLEKGYPASAIHIEVGTIPGTAPEGHAWLVIKTDKGDFALDNRFQSVMPSAALPYTGRQMQTGKNWSSSGVLLSNVPIEYMNGINAGAFSVDDLVVVQFVGQDWTVPKVVGFETNPKGGLYVYATRYVDDYWSVNPHPVNKCDMWKKQDYGMTAIALRHTHEPRTGTFVYGCMKATVSGDKIITAQPVSVIEKMKMQIDIYSASTVSQSPANPVTVIADLWSGAVGEWLRSLGAPTTTDWSGTALNEVLILGHSGGMTYVGLGFYWPSKGGGNYWLYEWVVTGYAIFDASGISTYFRQLTWQCGILRRPYLSVGSFGDVGISGEVFISRLKARDDSYTEIYRSSFSVPVSLAPLGHPRPLIATDASYAYLVYSIGVGTTILFMFAKYNLSTGVFSAPVAFWDAGTSGENPFGMSLIGDLIYVFGSKWLSVLPYKTQLYVLTKEGVVQRTMVIADFPTLNHSVATIK